MLIELFYGVNQCLSLLPRSGSHRGSLHFLGPLTIAKKHWALLRSSQSLPRRSFSLVSSLVERSSPLYFTMGKEGCRRLTDEPRVSSQILVHA